MLTTLIQLPEQSNPSAEDIFSAAHDLIFPDDASRFHGDPGSFVTYTSRKFGDITLKLSEPLTEKERKLYGQYLWNASVLLAELIGTADDTQAKGINWDVREERLLELGAGLCTGLAGIVSLLSGAEEVVVSDYPSSEILANIEINIKKNISADLKRKIAVEGHKWGVFTDRLSSTHAHRFTRIVSADCLWLSEEHENLITSILHFLSEEPSARVWVIAGFHTGRANLASFFETANEAGLVTEQICERDVRGRERSWTAEEQTENGSIAELEKWLMVATMKRRDPLT